MRSCAATRKRLIITRRSTDAIEGPTMISKRSFVAGLVCVGFAARAEQTPAQGTLYKSPDCTCCEGHAQYLKRNGIQVTVIESPDLNALKKEHGVPVELEGCHTILL